MNSCTARMLVVVAKLERPSWKLTGGMTYLNVSRSRIASVIPSAAMVETHGHEPKVAEADMRM